MGDDLTIESTRELDFADHRNSLLCKHCDTVKPLSDFYQSSKSRCKECTISNVKKYRTENNEKTRKYARERYQNNPEIKEILHQ